jgi:large subunit ribosomal protein L18
VYKSGRHIYAQVIDDVGGKTLVAASTLSPELKGKIKSTKNKEAAKEVGKLVAEKSRAAGVSRVVFDRNGFRYHGRIKTLADAAREDGLEF